MSTPSAGSPGGSKAPLLYLIGAAVQGLAAVAVQPFSIRLFGGARSQGWENAAFAISIMQVGLVILSAGLPLAITRAWLDPQDGPRKARAINGANDLLAVILSGSAFLVAAAFHAPAPVLASIVSMGALAVVIAAQSQLRAQGRPLLFVALAAGSSLVAHLCGLAAILLWHPTAAVFMTGFAAASVLTAVASVMLTKPLSPARAWPDVLIALKAGLPLLPHSLALILLVQGDAMLLKQTAPEGSTGVYLAAAVFALGPMAVIAGLNNAWTAQILKSAHHSLEEFEQVCRRTLSTAVKLAAALYGAALLAAWPMILLLAQGDPHSIQIAMVLPGISVGYALYIIASSVLFGRLRTRPFSWVTIAVVLLCAALAHAPARQGDLLAVAFVKVLGFAMLGLGYALFARLEVKLSLLKPLVLIAACAALSWAAAALYRILEQGGSLFG